ncbi:hypothetical protein RT99_20385 [Flavobacterium sp. MEB061]|nr:hypothetical protein RT99_20385 [Flavobacterium sp. MEB061]
MNKKTGKLRRRYIPQFINTNAEEYITEIIITENTYNKARFLTKNKLNLSRLVSIIIFLD